MRSKKRRLLLTVCLLVIAVAAFTTAAKGNAQNIPDLSSLDITYLLPDNQQVLPLPDGSFAVLSTDSTSCTYITLLNKQGQPVDYPATLNFTYRSAAVSGDEIYLDGDLPRSAGVQIYKYNSKTNRYNSNQILDVTCDYARGLYADSSGRIYLVTAPSGTEIRSDSPFWVYHFSDQPGLTVITGSPAADFDPSTSSSSSAISSEISSAPAPSSQVSSETPSSSSVIPPVSSQPDSSSSSSVPAPANPYRFSGTVTVESLQQRLNAEGRGGIVRVTSPDGHVLRSGEVGTGSIVEELINGKADSRVMAIIPGDVIGTGKLNEQDLQVLSDQITNRQGLSNLYRQAGDMNGDGKIDTSDLLLIKNRIG